MTEAIKESKIKSLSTAIEHALENILGEDMGFVLLATPTGTGKRNAYLTTNIHKEQAIQLMEHNIAVLEEETKEASETENV